MTNPDVISTRLVMDGRFSRLREDRLRHADGHEADYYYLERPRFVVVAPIEAGTIWMVEQYRPPLKRRSLELVMGVAPGGAEEMARTELREEAGLTPARLTRIGGFAPAPGCLAQECDLFLAEELSRIPRAPEPGEQDLVVRELPVAQALDKARSGEIVCGVTLAAFGLLLLSGALRA